MVGAFVVSLRRRDAPAGAVRVGVRVGRGRLLRWLLPRQRLGLRDRHGALRRRWRPRLDRRLGPRGPLRRYAAWLAHALASRAGRQQFGHYPATDPVAPSARRRLLPRLPDMLPHLATAGHATTAGFSVTNLIILVVVLAVTVPVVNRLRRSTSERRRARWAEEERQAHQSQHPQQPQKPQHDA